MTTGDLQQRARPDLVMNGARRMARTGEYADSQRIEPALRETGLAESLDAIGGPDLRSDRANLRRESRTAAR